MISIFWYCGFYSGYDPVAGRSYENGASETGNKTRITTSSHAPGSDCVLIFVWGALSSNYINHLTYNEIFRCEYMFTG